MGRVKNAFHSFRLMWQRFMLNSVGGGYLCPFVFRTYIYQKYGNKIAPGVTIYPHCFIGGGKLSVGKNTFISIGCLFDLSERIEIGQNVSIAMRAVFITSGHKVGGAEKRAADAKAAPITIDDGCWIGGNVTVLPGVHIGKGTIVAAGSVVVKDCDPNSLYAGVPARKIKTL